MKVSTERLIGLFQVEALEAIGDCASVCRDWPGVPTKEQLGSCAEAVLRLGRVLGQISPDNRRLIDESKRLTNIASMLVRK